MSPAPRDLQERLLEREEDVVIVKRIITVTPWLYTVATLIAGGWAIVTAAQGKIDSAALIVALTSAPTAFICWLSRAVAGRLLANLDLCHDPEVPAGDVR